MKISTKILNRYIETIPSVLQCQLLIHLHYSNQNTVLLVLQILLDIGGTLVTSLSMQQCYKKK